MKWFFNARLWLLVGLFFVNRAVYPLITEALGGFGLATSLGSTGYIYFLNTQINHAYKNKDYKTATFLEGRRQQAIKLRNLGILTTLGSAAALSIKHLMAKKKVHSQGAPGHLLTDGSVGGGSDSSGPLGRHEATPSRLGTLPALTALASIKLLDIDALKSSLLHERERTSSALTLSTNDILKTWKIHTDGQKRPTDEYRPSYQFDIGAHLGSIEALARGLKAKSGAVTSQCERERGYLDTFNQNRSVHISRVVADSSVSYATDFGVLEHKKVQNTHDLSCVAHSLSSSSGGYPYTGGLMARLFALYGAGNLVDVHVSAYAFTGQTTVDFAQNAQEFANFTGRPVFIWQWPGGSRAQSSSIVEPYDYNNNKLTTMTQKNLFLPEWGVKHSFEDAAHLIAYPVDRQYSHCDWLQQTSFVQSNRLNALNAYTAGVIISKFGECLSRLSARATKIDDLNFMLLALSLDAYEHLEMCRLGLAKKHGLDFSLSLGDCLQQLEGIVPDDVEKLRRMANTVIEDGISFLARQKFSVKMLHSLFLWEHYLSVYKWFTYIKDEAIMHSFMRRIWLIIVSQRSPSKTLDSYEQARFLIDANGIPLMNFSGQSTDFVILDNVIGDSVTPAGLLPSLASCNSKNVLDTDRRLFRKKLSPEASSLDGIPVDQQYVRVWQCDTFVGEACNRLYGQLLRSSDSDVSRRTDYVFINGVYNQFYAPTSSKKVPAA